MFFFPNCPGPPARYVQDVPSDLVRTLFRALFAYSADQIFAKLADCKSPFWDFSDYLDRDSGISHTLDLSSRVFECRDIFEFA